jgi:catechol 2,3-dioxygenase-like lactoylglutathione lyase family enzyme
VSLDSTTTCHGQRKAAVIDHTGFGVADVGRSANFYDAALAALGMRRVRQMPDNVGSDGIGYGVDYPVFWIDRYHPHSVKQHTAFAAKTKAEVDAFHAAALMAGGTDNGVPGPRRANYYAAFVLDPDGNNMEAVFRGD